MRTLVDITDRQIEELAAICEVKKVSRSELIRQAISYYIERNRPSTTKAFGFWRDRKIDGLDYQKQVRSEW